MGRISIIIVFLSFLILGVFTFFGGNFFLKDISSTPEEIIGKALPENYETQLSLQSKEGDVLVLIDRSNDLKLHIVKQSSSQQIGDITSTIPKNSIPVQFSNAQELLKAAKAYRVGSLSIDKANFLVRYLSSNIDPRRSHLAKELEENDQNNLNPEIILSGKKQSSHVILLNENTLYIATHPNRLITREQFYSSIEQIRS